MIIFTFIFICLYLSFSSYLEMGFPGVDYFVGGQLGTGINESVEDERQNN
jgi:hypothetical protein